MRRNLFYGIYFNKVHAIYVRGNFKNVTIDLAIHSHSLLIYKKNQSERLLRFNTVRYVFLLFYALMKHIILYVWIQWCNKTIQILLMKIRNIRKIQKIRTIVMCLSSSRKCNFFFARLKCTANGISMQNVNVLPNQWSHFWNFPLHI